MTKTLEQSIAELGLFAAQLRWEAVPEEVCSALTLVLLDGVGVTVAGARTPELITLRETWPLQPGAISILGTGVDCAAHDAMWLNGIAACCLELDEGNKFTRGHPSAHVLFAVLAESQARAVAGEEFMAALLVGHEVASRFGRAMTGRPGLHPHGHWGALGAAAAVARLRGLDAETIAGAIDAAAGLVQAPTWESALRGSFVRNAWIGAANVAGTVAANLAEAGLTSSDGTPELTLGGMLGELDVTSLTDELGALFHCTLSYLKIHSSCSYTHPPADAIIALRQQEHVELDRVSHVLVETHGLAAPLDRTEVRTRLAAMFSIPYVLAVALLEGEVAPDSFDPAHRRDPRLRGFMDKVEVRETTEMTDRLPTERAARVTLTLDNGRQVSREVSNPIGDAGNRPLDRLDVLHKLARLLGERDAQLVADVIDRLAQAPDVGVLVANIDCARGGP